MAPPPPLTPEEQGLAFHRRRIALGRSVQQLGLPDHVAARLLWIEEGSEDPPSDYPWPRLYARLFEALEEVVGAHLAAGGNWWDLSLPGWTTPQIRDAALTAAASAELERGRDG